MRLLWEELKKIWRPGVLGILVVLGALYYLLFPSFYVEYFCNGPTAQAEFDLAAEWLPRYGPTLEPEELPGLEAQLAREKKYDNSTRTQFGATLRSCSYIQQGKLFN